MQRELRRYQDALRITGAGMIALTLWSILRTVLYIELNPAGFEKVFGEVLGDMYDRRLAIILIFFLMVIDLIFRTAVGLRARRESRGERCGCLYLVIDAAFIIVSVYSIIYYFTPEAVKESTMDAIVTVIFELTSLYTSAELFFTAVKVRKLRKRIREEA